MTRHKEWFGVDMEKRAATVRSRPLYIVVKELLANALDAGATEIDLMCEIAQGTRVDGAGLRVFTVECTDNGSGCDDPQILRRVGSTTSDLHAEKRGRFGQGLIDAIGISDRAEIRTLGNRMLFEKTECLISRIRQSVNGLNIVATLRHSGVGFESIDDYFGSMIVPDGVEFRFNRRLVVRREPFRVISAVRLPTVVFDAETERVRKYQRSAVVEVYDQFDIVPMIYEMGIPVDEAPWSLPFDINVMQKTPLDTERNMLPSKFRANLISQLVKPMSDEFITYMAQHNDAPPEIKDDRANATLLVNAAQEVLIEKVTGAEKDKIVRRNPFDSDDLSESQELEHRGFTPINRGSLPAGVSELLQDTLSVAETHDRECKANFRTGPDFPPATERQTQCMAVFTEIGSALTGRPITCERVRGGSVAAAYLDGVISLNINVRHIWTDPLGEKTLGLIIHECAHEKVSGHAVGFEEEVRLLGGRLAWWVGNNHHRWTEFQADLDQESLSNRGSIDRDDQAQSECLLPVPLTGREY